MLLADELKFDENGLVPAIVVDWFSGDVLTLAYMNRESLQVSMKEKRVCFWSRSRGELWRKGETSGNFQDIVDITADCDRDALLIRVKKAGPACHLGSDSCFTERVFESGADKAEENFSLTQLYRLIEERKTKGKEGSYTSYLFEKGLDKMLKKIGEESTEVIIASKSNDKKETIYELADLLYHAMVVMVEMGITTGDVFEELASRYNG